MADDGDALAGLDGEGDVLEHPGGAGVGRPLRGRRETAVVDGGGGVREPDVLELDPAGRIRREVLGVFGVADVGLGVEESEDALGGRHGAL